MKSLAVATYNERLFNGGLRGFLHSGRFQWFRSQLRHLDVEPESVCELGCYDGKLINYLPRAPRRYVGFDANWENGLDLAANLWSDQPGYSFRLCRTPQEMRFADGDAFDVSVVMETLEHVSPDMVSGYLEQLARHTKKYVFITVPNEKGPLFLAKWTANRLLSRDAEPYTFREVYNATLGRMHKVARHEHKGFDYTQLVREVSRHFKVVEVSGIPFSLLPTWMGFGVGIVGRPR
jgi:2-polyprenyl-3-methyl-5-hydroxy-6-metoxy-1,4-benzoquinol methylase